jgi:hypothetical protein
LSVEDNSTLKKEVAGTYLLNYTDILPWRQQFKCHFQNK